MLPAPQTPAELSDLVDDAILEMRDLAQCADDDMDDEMADLVPTFNALEHALGDFRQSLAGTGRHETGNAAPKDLPFMRLARSYRHVIPFFSMLDAINRAYRQGIGD